MDITTSCLLLTIFEDLPILNLPQNEGNEGQTDLFTSISGPYAAALLIY